MALSIERVARGAGIGGCAVAKGRMEPMIGCAVRPEWRRSCVEASRCIEGNEQAPVEGRMEPMIGFEPTTY